MVSALNGLVESQEYKAPVYIKTTEEFTNNSTGIDAIDTFLEKKKPSGLLMDICLAVVHLIIESSRLNATQWQSSHSFVTATNPRHSNL